MIIPKIISFSNNNNKYFKTTNSTITFGAGAPLQYLANGSMTSTLEDFLKTVTRFYEPHKKILNFKPKQIATIAYSWYKQLSEQFNIIENLMDAKVRDMYKAKDGQEKDNVSKESDKQIMKIIGEFIADKHTSIRRLAPADRVFTITCSIVSKTIIEHMRKYLITEWLKRIREEVDYTNPDIKNYANEIRLNIIEEMRNKFFCMTTDQQSGESSWYDIAKEIDSKMINVNDDINVLKNQYDLLHDPRCISENLLRTAINSIGKTYENFTEEERLKYEKNMENLANSRKQQFLQNRVIAKMTAYIIKSLKKEDNFVYEAYLFVHEGKTIEEVPDVIIGTEQTVQLGEKYDVTLSTAKKIAYGVFKNCLTGLLQDTFISTAENMLKDNLVPCNKFSEELMTKFINSIPIEIMQILPQKIFIDIAENFEKRIQKIFDGEQTISEEKLSKIVQKIPKEYMNNLYTQLKSGILTRTKTSTTREIPDEFIAKIFTVHDNS